MNRSVQAHPFHLVEASPWPLAVSFSLLTTTLSGVMTFHGYSNGTFLLTLGLISTVATMTLWFKDVTREGRSCRNVLSLNLTICWKLLRTCNTFMVTIYKIGQSAGNQRS
jgi:cytochrome c oxidase subunit III